MKTYSRDLVKYNFTNVFTPNVYHYNKSIIVMDYVEGELFRQEHVNDEMAKMLLANRYSFHPIAQCNLQELLILPF